MIRLPGLNVIASWTSGLGSILEATPVGTKKSEKNPSSVVFGVNVTMYEMVKGAEKDCVDKTSWPVRVMTFPLVVAGEPCGPPQYWSIGQGRTC